MSAPSNAGPEWGICQFCGVAVAPGAEKCGICGAANPLSSSEAARSPKKVRRWLALTKAFRILVVIAVIGGLAYAILSAEVSGPPSLTGDPLTTAGSYTLGPGNFTVISGEITGGDYITGNFTSTHPLGVNIELAVYNSTQWVEFRTGGQPSPLYSLGPAFNTTLVYSPLVTDTYYFVFSNPYAPATNLTVTVYITTLYNSNVANDGFGD